MWCIMVSLVWVILLSPRCRMKSSAARRRVLVAAKPLTKVVGVVPLTSITTRGSQRLCQEMRSDRGHSPRTPVEDLIQMTTQSSHGSEYVGRRFCLFKGFWKVRVSFSSQMSQQEEHCGWR